MLQSVRPAAVEDRDGWLASARQWAASHVDTVDWKDAGAVGITSLPVPAGDGGAGAGYRTTCRALDAVADACGHGGFWFGVAAQLWSCQEPLVRFGTPEQKSRHLPGLMAGSHVGAHAVTEPDAGSDVLSMAATARDEDGRWHVSGTKTFVTNGQRADVFVALARTGRGTTIGAFTAFVVPREAAGVRVTPLRPAGLDDWDLGTVEFDDVVVDHDAVLGEVGGGYAILSHVMRVERALIMAPAVGIMRRSLRRAIAYLRARTQFGRPLVEHEPVRQRLVEAHLAVQTAADLVDRSAELADRNELSHSRASTTKLAVSRAYADLADNLAAVYGGYALFADSGIPALRAQALASRSYSGTSEMQSTIIAKELLT